MTKSNLNSKLESRLNDSFSINYTYMSQRVNIEEAIQSGVLGEAKGIAPGATLQELNVRKPISEIISIDTIGGVLNVSAQMLDSNLISVNNLYFRFV